MPSSRKQSISTEKPRTRCAVFHVWSKRSGPQDAGYLAEKCEEAVNLAEALDLDVIHADIIGIQTYTPATLFGSGKVQTIAEFCADNTIDLVFINHALTPIQQRNLEKDFKAKVIDRTGLILEIFGDRAKTKEGMLQVELAALSYQRSRLVRSWTHLERQRGGFGFTGGPGETQIELDRRLIDERIAVIKKDLADVVRTRDLNRKKRQSVPYPVIALVGYTNAGKSTLFNRLTDANVLAKDMLFATLDPTMRRFDLGQGFDTILSDTVGFISDLPTELIASFRATLEEVLEADLILHVIDVSNPFYAEQMNDVYAILKDLNVLDEEGRSQKALIEVFNKTDRLSEDKKQDLIRQMAFERHSKAETQIAISSLSGDNIDGLKTCIRETLKTYYDKKTYHLSFIHDSKALSWLYENMHILDKTENDDASLTVTVAGSVDKQSYFEKVILKRDVG